MEMTPVSPELLLFVVAFLAGAVHVASPDHWLPAALWSWRRGWTTRRTAGFAALFLSNHLALGLLIFLFFELAARLLFPQVGPDQLFAASLAVALLIWGVRVVRYLAFDRAVETRPNDLWNLGQILLFLGPAETLLPILVRSVGQGWGWFLPFAAFGLGTLIAGTAGIVWGRWSWNRGDSLPLRLESARGPIQLLPAAIGILAAWAASGLT